MKLSTRKKIEEKEGVLDYQDLRVPVSLTQRSLENFRNLIISDNENTKAHASRESIVFEMAHQAQFDQIRILHANGTCNIHRIGILIQIFRS